MSYEAVWLCILLLTHTSLSSSPSSSPLPSWVQLQSMDDAANAGVHEGNLATIDGALAQVREEAHTVSSS